jgi:hypothetical protein
MYSFRVYAAVFFFPVFGSITFSFSSTSAPYTGLPVFESTGGLVLLSFLARPKSIRYIKWASYESLPITTFAGFKSL